MVGNVPIHGRQIEDSARPRLSISEHALFRSQGGPLSNVPFTRFLSVVSFRIPPPSDVPAGVAVSFVSLATTGRVAEAGVFGATTIVMVRDLDLLNRVPVWAFAQSLWERRGTLGTTALIF